jgi:hypothetical protein
LARSVESVEGLVLREVADSGEVTPPPILTPEPTFIPTPTPTPIETPKVVQEECKKTVKKVGWGDSNYWQQYAYEISGYDDRFVIMLEAENGMWSHDRRHDPSLNTVGVDWGFCGTNDYYHPSIVNDERFIGNPYWQMEKCLELWKKGTTFYGWKTVSRREKARKNLIFTCE